MCLISISSFESEKDEFSGLFISSDSKHLFSLGKLSSLEINGWGENI